ncbi:MAG: ECF transporter S component [Clostridiaceae bacterium]|nr:ECF transporter S component [Clostridiaceae bacterium]
MQSKSIRRLVTLALLAAIAVALCLLVRFPIFAAAPWLEYDAGDIPVIFASFLFGPWWALAVTFVLCVIQGMTVSASSGIIGIAMHFFATGAFVTVSGLLFSRFPKRVALSMLAGAAAAIVMMVPLNFLFTPMFGTPLEAVRQMMLPVIVPFNAVKFGANAVIAYLLYKPLARYFANYRA